MEQHQPPDYETKDEFIALLADRHRRAVLAYFRESTDDVASLQELSEQVARRGHEDADAVAVQLHHAALPRLAESGVVEFDARDGTVRYRGHPDLGEMVDAVTEL